VLSFCRAFVALTSLLTLAGCSVGSGADEPGNRASECELGANAVPVCGVLWGISTQPRSMRHLESLEEQLGRRFDLVYHYNDVKSVVPDGIERQEADDGRLLHIAIAARDYGAKGSTLTWADVAEGRFDASLAAQARGIAALKSPVFVTFAQEGNSKAKLGVNGSAAEFKAAWRHLHEIYRSAGADNAVWTWVMTGSEENLDRAATLWPGNDVVDWISWNVYNGAGCAEGGDLQKFESFEDGLRIFYDFVKQRGPSIGMDPSKPMMISEAGSMRYAVDPDLGAGWYAGIPSTLRKYPQVKAVTLWNSSTDMCDFRFDTSPEAIAAVKRAGLDVTVDRVAAMKDRLE
jgi:hypothetical protein